MEYSGEVIRVLKGVEGIRMRPAMYIGSVTERGNYALVNEVLDNCANQAMAQLCSKMSVRLSRDGTVTIEDDGPGISIENSTGEEVSILEIHLTSIHACACKLDRSLHKVAGSMHGVGLAAVNALSEQLSVETTWQGRRYSIEFQRGEKTKDLCDLGPTNVKGTRVRMKPDSEIFGSHRINPRNLEHRLRELSCLIPSLRVEWEEEETGSRFSIQNKQGALGLLESMTDRDEWGRNGKPIHFRDEIPVTVSGLRESYDSTFCVDIAFCTVAERAGIFGYCNTVRMFDGGWHVSIFEKTLKETLREQSGKALKKLDKNSPPILAVISIRVPEPSFVGSRKARLGDDHALMKVYENFCKTALQQEFAKCPEIFERLVHQLG